MSMDLEAIDRMGLRLYREPELAEVIQDALCELDPPLTWAMWLERGTLERLAELMSLLAGPASAWPDDLWGWVRNLEGDGAAVDFPNPEVTEYESIYPSLCAALRVPAVQIEIGIPVDAPWQGEPRRPVVFGPPSVELAKATLRLLVNFAPQDGPGWVHYAMGHHTPDITAEVKRLHPNATSWRCRIDQGNWIEPSQTGYSAGAF